MHYLIQAGMGQLALLNHARSIQEVIQDERIPPRTRELLAEIGAIKKYGEENGLKPTSNYSEYVHLDRKFAVWVVSACEPLRFQSKVWHFPIVGSFPYLGWFHQKDAARFAEDLKKEGWDVDLRGATAYSTLGWFRDAVLSTMISQGDEALGDLVNVVLHESVHASVYIQGQSYFDESIASFVADQLTLAYFNQKQSASPAQTQRILSQKQAYMASEERRREMEKALHAAYEELQRLYQSAKTVSEKLKLKEQILSDLKKSLEIKRAINNATIIQYKTYSTGGAEFSQLLEKCQGNWVRFMKAIKRLKPESFEKPQQDELGPAILPLVKEGC